MSPSPPLVTVTGATGFIALHCIAQLLLQGYRVRGTIRAQERDARVRRALATLTDAGHRLETVTAHLEDDAGWAEAVDGATFVLHTASPVLARLPRPGEDVIAPARDGTLRVLEAAAGAGVRRVVLTSSIAAVMAGATRTPGRIFTEWDWTDPDACRLAYNKGKTLAERAAWEFVAQDPSRMELVAINPSFVLGPSLSGADNASNEIVRKALDRELPLLPRIMFPIVDVRDVATAHVLAMTEPRAAGERFLISEGEYWYTDIVAVLRDGGFDVPSRQAPDWLVRTLGWVNPSVRMLVDRVGWEHHVSSDKAREILGWTSRPMPQSVLDTARAIAARRATATRHSPA